MKERSILMTGAMVRAAMREVEPKRKTRRIINSKKFKLELCTSSEPPHLRYREFNYERGHGLYESGSGPFELSSESDQHFASSFCPYGQPGDRLWVKETFQSGVGLCLATPGGVVTDAQAPRWIYRADDKWSLPPGTNWRPSIFMPRQASRLTLEIVSVRVERLQDISEEDAEAEGIQGSDTMAGEFCVGAFKRLWESIHGPESWALNPWVWVVGFKRVEEGK